MDIQPDDYTDNLQDINVYYQGMTYAQRSFVSRSLQKAIKEWMQLKKSEEHKLKYMQKAALAQISMESPKRIAVYEYIQSLPSYPEGAVRAFLQEMSK